MDDEYRINGLIHVKRNLFSPPNNLTGHNEKQYDEQTNVKLFVIMPIHNAKYDLL